MLKFVLVTDLYTLQGIKPGPADYQQVRTAPPRLQRYKPFGSATERLPDDGPENKKPPGFVSLLTPHALKVVKSILT